MERNSNLLQSNVKKKKKNSVMHPQNIAFWRVCLPASMFSCGYIYACKDTCADPLLPHKAHLHKQKVRHFRWCFCVFTGWWKRKCNLAIWLKERRAHTHTEGWVCMAAPVLWDKGLLQQHPLRQSSREREHDRRVFTQGNEVKALHVQYICVWATKCVCSCKLSKLHLSQFEESFQRCTLLCPVKTK